MTSTGPIGIKHKPSRKLVSRPETQGFGGPWGSEGGYSRQGSGGAGSEQFSDFFESIFGNRGRGGAGRSGSGMPGEDIETDVQLGLREVLTGVTKRVNLREPRTCSTCQGSGTLRGRSCVTCQGTGMTTEYKTIEVRIPAGVQDGTRVRVAGKGQPGTHGGKRGDLYLHVVIPSDPIFRRQGSDLHVTLPVYPWEAMLGAEVTAPTLTEPVKVKVPPGSKADGKLRLKGKGLPSATGGHGDLFLTCKLSCRQVSAKTNGCCTNSWANSGIQTREWTFSLRPTALNLKRDRPWRRSSARLACVTPTAMAIFDSRASQPRRNS